MKLCTSTLILVASLASLSPTAAIGLTYAPNNDVNDHSMIALDTLDITAAIDSNNVTLALDIYTNGKHRESEGKNLQAMAAKDWVQSDLENVEDYVSFAALFHNEGSAFLDSYNLDAMQCNGSFAGLSDDICKTAAKKNLICTSLLYAQYEAVNAIQYSNEKNWDELFAFWNGVYDAALHSSDVLNKGGAGAVQASRDADFSTSFRELSIEALREGQEAFSGSSVNKEKLIEAYEEFKKANLATFTQATLKYALLFEEAGLEQSAIDSKWAEGYTYFRCGAGLMNPELALYINYVFDPRDKSDMILEPKATYCKIVKKMLSLPEIGYGLTLDDLNMSGYAPTSSIKEDCGLESLKHVKGMYYGSNGDLRTYVPVLELLVVICIYFGSYIFLTRKSKVC